MSDVAVEAQNVRKVYGHDNTEVVALAGATFSVNSGEVVALLGPSGAGKSTLLNILGLVTAPTTGTVVIGGISVVEGPRELVGVRAFRRQHIGFVFQKANLIPFLTAIENVQLAMEINDLPSSEARRFDYRPTHLPFAAPRFGTFDQAVAVDRCDLRCHAFR